MAQATDKRTGWFAALKVGDEFGVHDGHAGQSGRTYRLVKVERITPAGRIFATKGYEFQSTGRGVGSDVWHSTNAVEATEEFRALVRRQNIEGWVAKYTQHLDPEKVKAASDADLTALLNSIKPFLKSEG